MPGCLEIDDIDEDIQKEYCVSCECWGCQNRYMDCETCMQFRTVYPCLASRVQGARFEQQCRNEEHHKKCSETGQPCIFAGHDENECVNCDLGLEE